MDVRSWFFCLEFFNIVYNFCYNWAIFLSKMIYNTSNGRFFMYLQLSLLVFLWRYFYFCGLFQLKTCKFNPRKTGVCEYLERPMDFQFRGSQWSYKLCCILPSIYINSFQTFWWHNIHFEVCRMSLKWGRKCQNPIK